MKKLLPIITAAVIMFSTTTSYAEDTKDSTAKFLEKKFNISDSAKEFKTIQSQIDELGCKHVKFEQMVDGIPVYGGQYIVHYNADGSIYSSNGTYDSKAKAFKANSAYITAKDAVKAAKAEINFTDVDPTRQLEPDRFAADLYLYNVDGQYIPVYLVKANWLHENTFGNWRIFVNADTGEIIDKYNNIQYAAATGTGIGVLGDTKALNLDYISGRYYLKDLSRAAQTWTYNCNNSTAYPGTSFSDTDNIYDAPVQRPAVDAHYYIGKTYDFTKNILGRNGIDGYNMVQKASVHYGVNYTNAFWSGTQLVFGDGDGIQSSSWSGALDLVAHEYAHGITESLGGLEYRDESGSLNEAFSDLFGCSVEYYAQSSQFDWTMGEDIWTPGTIGDAIRNLSNPEAYEDSDHVDDPISWIPEDNEKNIQSRSLIPGHAGYTMATTNNSVLGIYGMMKVWYRANAYYFTYTTTFSQARAATLQSAADFYGIGSAQYNAVAEGWTHVGVY